MLPRDGEEDAAWGGPSNQMNAKALRASAQSRVDDLRNGQYRIRWTATVSSHYDILISLNEEMVQQGKARVRIAPSVCDPGKSRGWGTGLRTGIAGAPANFYMSIHDKFGNQCERGVAKVKLSLEGPEDIQGVVADNDDGTYRLSYWARRAGNYLIKVTCDGQHVLGTPRKIVVEQGDSGDRRWFKAGDGFRGAMAGDLAVFRIQTIDAEGTKRWTGGDRFRIQLEAKSGTDQQLADIDLITRRVIKDRGQGVNIPDLKQLDPGYVHDPLGELVASSSSVSVGKPTDLAAAPSTRSMAVTRVPPVPASVEDNGDGTYTVTYTATIAAEYFLRVYLFKPFAKKDSGGGAVRMSSGGHALDELLGRRSDQGAASEAGGLLRAEE